jgi:AmmeMemoRadiSam system protein A
MMEIPEVDGLRLCRYARSIIGAELGLPVPNRPTGGVAEIPTATFVTLRHHGRLHGCMGSLEPRRALADDVAHNAVAAAFVDPRARPLVADDVAVLDVEVTILGPLVPIEGVTDRESAIAALKPHVDGVVLSFRGRRGTFLPQVWQSLPEPRDFLTHLEEKAGLPTDFWSDDVKLFRYRVQKFEEHSSAVALRRGGLPVE